MNQTKVVVDTDVLSALMRGNPSVLRRAQDYLAEHSRLAISMITRYEILRGLKSKGAVRQEREFERFSAISIVVLPITEQVIVRAATIYADLSNRGELIPDADVLIAATALVDERHPVTNNERHFRRIPGLTVENWLNP
jgi:tRNA(fMet)-specific endonuclease VapC